MSENDKSSGSQLLSWGLLIILSLIWGSSFILIKKSLVAFPAPMVGALRVIFAALFLLPFAYKNLKAVEKAEIKYLFVVGLTGSFIPAILFALAQTQISSSIAGVLNSLTPISVLVIGFVFFSQKIYKSSVWGVLLGLLGSFILIVGFSIDSLADINFYAFFVILATIMYGINLNIIKYKLINVKPTHITSISVSMVFPIAAVYLLFFTPALSMNYNKDFLFPLLAVAVLGIVGTGLALFLFNRLVKVSSAIFTSSVTYLIPVVAIAWGIVDGESMLYNHVIGMILILGGIILINKKPKK